jgi:glucose dehydrogenase
MALGGAAGTLLGSRPTFVLSGLLMVAVGLVLLRRIRRVAIAPALTVGAPVGSR